MTKPSSAELAAPTPYMRCVTDFWGNCTGVASNRHDYRWRYVRPGKRTPEMRESATARENMAQTKKTAAREKTAVAREKAPQVPAAESAAPSKKTAAREKAPAVAPAPETAIMIPSTAASPKVRGQAPQVHDSSPTSKSIPLSEKVSVRDRPNLRNTAPIRETTAICHDRRRVVGDERPSQDDARRAAENGWMGAVRYDYGERYQDINRAKDVRLSCVPSSVSSVLKTPHFRCAVEATPCRETQGTPTEPDERRYDPPSEPNPLISRK